MDSCLSCVEWVQVGDLWDGAGLTATPQQTATGVRLDKVIRLSGVDNIVGRALIIHGNGTLTQPGKATRVAQVGVHPCGVCGGYVV